jgi:putative ABC transport system permease protein
MHLGPILRAMSHNRMRFALIVMEIAITLAIVTNCVNMIVGEREKMLRKSGFDDDNLFSVITENFGPEWSDNGLVDNTVRADLRELHSIPGVKDAAATYFLPWQGGGSSGAWTTTGFKGQFQAQFYGTTPEIFHTLGVKIVEGRNFIPTDTPVDPNTPTRAAIISGALAHRVWGSANPLGKIITRPDGARPRTVVGVIDDFYNPYAWNIGEDVVFSPGRPYDSTGCGYLIRVEPGAMKSVVSAFEARLAHVNGHRTFRVFTVPQLKRGFFASSRLAMNGMAVLVVVLIFITALGIFGVTAMTVAERTRQIGTRRALGATRGDILQHFLAENWIATTAGLTLGIAGAYSLNFLLLSHVSDMKLPWQIVAGGVVLLWINGLVSTLIPALRATLVPPSIATRSV